MKRRLLILGLAAASLTSAVLLAPRPAYSSFSIVHQIANVHITVYVGITPTPAGMPQSAAGAGGAETVKVSVGATSRQYIQPSSRNVVFVGNPGQTVTTPCAEQIWVAPGGDMFSGIETGLTNALTNLNGTGTIPTNDVQFQSSSITTGTAWTSLLNYAQAGSWQLLTTLTSNEAPVCLTMRVTIPAGTSPGTYFGVMPLLYFTATGSPATPP